MWDTRDGSVTRDLLTGITGVWQVVFDRRFCIAASNRQDNTFLEVWDFGGDDDTVDGDVDSAFEDDDDDNNSETDDPFDEAHLDEHDIGDSESEEEDGDRDDPKRYYDDDGDYADASLDPGTIIVPREQLHGSSPTAAYVRRGSGQRVYRLAHAFAAGPSSASTSGVGIGMPLLGDEATRHHASMTTTPIRRQAGRSGMRNVPDPR